MRRRLDEHIRLRAWVVLAARTARASYFRLTRHGAVVPTLRAWRKTPFRRCGPNPARRVRPPRPPARVWRDWVIVAVVVLWSAVEAMFREDVAWRPIALTVAVIIALTLLWRRTHPLAAIAITFGTLTVIDVARIFAAEHAGLLWSIAASLVLPYSLFRWRAGREAGIGLGVLLTWLAVTSVADPTGAVQVVGGFEFVLFSAALGASIRYYVNARIRDIERAKLRQRNQFARELHDTVGHYVSAIAIQAQAGRTLAASHPDRALAALETIEDAASRTLEEMRAMVGVLRDGAEPELAPQPDVAEIRQRGRSPCRL
jgi:signal transduction histidine kinase